MTAIEVLAWKVREARRFRYIPDSEGLAGLDALLADEWDTAVEFEARGGGGCDGYSTWTAQRQHEDDGMGLRAMILLAVALLGGCAAGQRAPLTPWTTPAVERERATCLDAEGLWMETRTLFQCRPLVRDLQT